MILKHDAPCGRRAFMRATKSQLSLHAREVLFLCPLIDSADAVEYNDNHTLDAQVEMDLPYHVVEFSKRPCLK